MNAHTKQRTGEFNMPAMLKEGVGIDELLYVLFVSFVCLGTWVGSMPLLGCSKQARCLIYHIYTSIHLYIPPPPKKNNKHNTLSGTIVFGPPSTCTGTSAGTRTGRSS